MDTPPNSCQEPVTTCPSSYQEPVTTCSSSYQESVTVSTSISKLFLELKLDVLGVLTHDVRGNGDFVSALSEFADQAQEYTRLRDLYHEYSVFQRKQSRIKEGVIDANATLSEVRCQLSAISAIQIAVSSGLTLGNMARAQEKLALMTKCFKTLVVGKQSMRNAVRHLMRRNAGIMKRMTNFEPRSVQLECSNVALLWEDAYNHAEYDIASSQPCTRILSGFDLLKCLAVIQSESAVSAQTMFEQVRISSSKIETPAAFNNCLHQVLNAAPVLLLQYGKRAVFADVHQFVLDPEGHCLNDLLCLCEDKPEECQEDPEHRFGDLDYCDDEEIADESTHETAERDGCSDVRSDRLGRPPKHHQFPQLVTETVRFLELHGRAAPARRRCDTTNSLGVTLEDLRKHLLSVIPNLQESGLSRTTVHELMLPPRQKTRNSKRYKGVVTARVGVKRNDLPQHMHEDRHFCASQVKLAMEFGAKHADNVATVSADDMNKVNIGVPAVSRYHQLRHFFLSGDSPDLPDHDFPVTGSNKIVPSGYMFLNTRRSVSGRPSSADRCCRAKHHHGVTTCRRRGRSLSPDRIRQSHGTSHQVDKVGRLHYECARSGPVYIFCRSVLFHPSSAFTHKEDLCELADIAMSEGKSILTVVVDGGPDWTFKSMTTFIAMGRVWKNKNLDGLFLVTYAPGQSKYNPIERQWASRSRNLSGVTFKACLPGEDKPPSQQRDLTDEERSRKQAAVHNMAIAELCTFWHGQRYNDYPVTAIPNRCEHEGCLPEEKEVHEFLSAGVRKLRELEYRPLVAEFQFLMHHACRSHYQLGFLKCSSELCSHCHQNPVQALSAVGELRKYGGCMPSPKPSKTHPGHYNTYMEFLCELEESPLPDEHRPSAKGAVNRCTQQGCCYVFRSCADENRHMMIVHPVERTASMAARRRDVGTDRQNPSEKMFTCRAEVDGAECGLMFSSKYFLGKHQTELGHKVSRGRPRMK